MRPSNIEYVEHHQLDPKLGFMRTIYIPYQRLIIISGHDHTHNRESRKVFQCHMTNSEFEVLPSIKQGR